LIKNDVLFLAKLLEAARQPLNFKVDEVEYSASVNSKFIELVQTPSRKHEEIENIQELAKFIRESNTDHLLPVDKDIYTEVLREVMKAANEQSGISRRQMETLIGSLAEYLPEEVEKYQRLLVGIV
jgi:hypothetical protein